MDRIMKVCIDPGHGGADSGAIGEDPFRYAEKDFNLSICKIILQKLETWKHWGCMTRRLDTYVPLVDRANYANERKADLFISVHANAAYSAVAEGMEVFFFPESPHGKMFAESVLDNMSKKFSNHKNRGVKEANFTVLRMTTMPAILVECEFITNPTRLKFLANPESQDKIASAIVAGISFVKLK